MSFIEDFIRNHRNELDILDINDDLFACIRKEFEKKRIESFIENNVPTMDIDFDSKKLWNNIKAKIETENIPIVPRKTSISISLNSYFLRAAAIFIIIFLSMVYFRSYLGNIDPSNSMNKELVEALEHEPYYLSMLNNKISLIRNQQGLTNHTQSILSEIHLLDSSYNVLKEDLIYNFSNREEIIQAMMENLKIRMQLLDDQLYLLRELPNYTTNKYHIDI